MKSRLLQGNSEHGKNLAMLAKYTAASLLLIPSPQVAFPILKKVVLGQDGTF